MSDRIRRAEELLTEAVYASRARQAAGVSLLSAREKDGSSPTNCGLGRAAAVELGLSERGRSALEALWPGGPAPQLWERVRERVARWVERSDQLDRDRNHFLKAFRTRHGFDRRAYTPEQLAAYEQGLAEVNARLDAERRAAAEELLGPDG
jgi:hypothetical protein